jgi:hypothetical protein
MSAITSMYSIIWTKSLKKRQRRKRQGSRRKLHIESNKIHRITGSHREGRRLRLISLIRRSLSRRWSLQKLDSKYLPLRFIHLETVLRARETELHFKL